MNDVRKVLSYNDVLLCPRNSMLEHISDAKIEIDYNSSIPFTSVPLINAPMDTVCSPKLLHCLHETFGLPVTIHRWFKCVEDQIKYYKECNINYDKDIFIAIGNVTKWKEWIDKLLEFRYGNTCSFGLLVDVANGDTKATCDSVKYIRDQMRTLYSSSVDKEGLNIMAGNIATRSGFARLQDAGADFIRVGIGGGSICSTRLNIGFGIPTLTSVFDCAKIKDTAYLVADGGIEYSGDIMKAIAAGADMVMAGKMFAATDLSGGEKITQGIEEKPVAVRYRGMASKESIEKLNSKKSTVSVEGVSGYIPYKGTTNEVVAEVIGNMRTAISYYAGCTNWNQFRKKVKFLEITTQGWNESLTRVGQ